MSDDEKEPNGDLKRIETHLVTLNASLQELKSDWVPRIVTLEVGLARDSKDNIKHFDDLKRETPWFRTPITWQFMVVFVICIGMLMWMASIVTTLSITRDDMRADKLEASNARLDAARRDGGHENAMATNRADIEALKAAKK